MTFIVVSRYGTLLPELIWQPLVHAALVLMVSAPAPARR